MNWHRSLVLALAIAILVLAIVPQDAGAVPYRIRGYLRDAQGDPIPNANITLTGEVYDIMAQDYVTVSSWTRTDPTGFYQIAPGVAEPGGYDLGSTVTLTYYQGVEPAASKVLTLNGDSAWLNLTYREKFSLVDAVLSPVGLVSMVIVVTVLFVGYYMYTAEARQEKERERGDSEWANASRRNIRRRGNRRR